jgi:putative redox protein
MTGQRSEKITFTGADGKSSLAARLDHPQGEPVAWALFAHCFTCGKDIFAASRVAEGLNNRGIGVLRFDFTGLGASEGEFANTDFSSNVGDLAAAAGWMRDQGKAAKILIGHSLGGAAILAAAGDIPEAVAVSTIAAPADPGHVRHLLKDAEDVIEREGEAEVQLAGRAFRIRKQFLDDIDSHRLEERIGKLHKALLIFHSPLDNVVGIENATRIFVAAKHPKSFISLDDAGHLLGRRRDAAYVANVLAAWAGRYVGGTDTLDERPAEAATRAEDLPSDVIVTESGQGKFAQIVSVGDRHRLYADEPAAFGGNDTGPSPYDLLMASLGACTNMTLRLYAEHKNIPLQSVSVTLRHAKIHARDCESCETKEGRIDRIDRELTIEGTLDDATRQKLLEIANKCPVHRTLHSEVWIETTLND